MFHSSLQRSMLSGLWSFLQKFICFRHILNKDCTEEQKFLWCIMSIIISVIFFSSGIIVLLIFHFCIAGRSLIRQPAENGLVVRSSSNGGTRMFDEDLKKLPCFLYKVEETERDSTEDTSECAVCLERFKTGENCRLLTNCNHSFHVKCIDSWLVQTPYCPICRTIALKQSC